MRGRGLVVMVAAVVLAGSTAAGAAASGEDRALPAPVADYRFSGNLRSSVGTAPNLRSVEPRTPNTFATERDGATSRRVLQFAQGNGLRLNNSTSVVPRGKYTIAIDVRFDTVTGYVRLVNFQGDASDTGLYVYNQTLSLYPNPVEFEQFIDADEWVTVVATRTGSGRFRAYVDGTPVIDVEDGENKYASVSAENVLRFFRDNSNREESSGAVDRIRLWNVPLTAAQVRQISG